MDKQRIEYLYKLKYTECNMDGVKKKYDNRIMELESQIIALTALKIPKIPA